MEAVDNSSSVKNNDIIFYAPENAAKCSFEITQTFISKERNILEAKASFENGALTISVEALRDNSKDVAEYFKKNVKDGFVVGTKTSTPMPEKLHFALKGILTINFKNGTKKEYGMVIGQGHTHDNRNNWWVGHDFGVKEKSVNEFDIFAR